MEEWNLWTLSIVTTEGVVPQTSLPHYIPEEETSCTHFADANRSQCHYPSGIIAPALVPWGWGGKPHKNSKSHIDVSLSRQPLVKGERLVRYEVNTVMLCLFVAGQCLLRVALAKVSQGISFILRRVDFFLGTAQQ